MRFNTAPIQIVRTVIRKIVFCFYFYFSHNNDLHDPRQYDDPAAASTTTFKLNCPSDSRLSSNMSRRVNKRGSLIVSFLC